MTLSVIFRITATGHGAKLALREAEKSRTLLVQDIRESLLSDLEDDYSDPPLSDDSEPDVEWKVEVIS